MTITHYVPGDNDNSACNKTTAAIHMDKNLMSSQSRHVNCPACIKVFTEMRNLGFYPKY